VLHPSKYIDLMKNEKTPLKDLPSVQHTVQPATGEDQNQDSGVASGRSGSDTSRKTLFIDMDNVLVDFTSGIAKLDERTQLAYEGRLDDVPGIFALMDPMPGALEAYATLCQHFDTYILSTAPWHNPTAWGDKLLWVHRYLNDHAYKRLILSHHKHLNKGHYLVDDRPNNGATHFPGMWLQFGSEQFSDWEIVTEWLMARR
jgi:5'-nucleotidase